MKKTTKKESRHRSTQEDGGTKAWVNGIPEQRVAGQTTRRAIFDDFGYGSAKVTIYDDKTRETILFRNDYEPMILTANITKIDKKDLDRNYEGRLRESTEHCDREQDEPER